jgi:hypothetical protein
VQVSTAMPLRILRSAVQYKKKLNGPNKLPVKRASELVCKCGVAQGAVSSLEIFMRAIALADAWHNSVAKRAISVKNREWRLAISTD